MRPRLVYTLLAGALVLGAWLAFFWWHRRNLDAAIGVLAAGTGG